MKSIPYVPSKIIGDVVNMLDGIGAYKATKYLEANLIVRVTRRGKLDKRSPRQEFVLTIGKPNAKEQEFVKKCKKAGESFPLKKMQLKYPAKPKK